MTRLGGAALALAAALCAGGVLAGAPGWLMGLLLAGAVVAWDRALLAVEHRRGGPPATATRLRPVALAAGLAPGLALAALLRGHALALPFPAALAAAAALALGLLALARSLTRGGPGGRADAP
ncbi:MAG: hypothetical protein QM767_00300 [Anaeromyxobacter sp.]